jgi:hypothetical protein
VHLSLLVGLLVADAEAGKKNKAQEAPAVAFDAVAYNDKIVEEQLEIGKGVSALMASFESPDPAVAVQAADTLEARINQAITTVSALAPAEGDAALRDSAVALFRFYLKTSQLDYRRLMAILADQAVTAEEEAEVTTITARITAEEQGYDGAFTKAQETFAARYGIVLTPPEPPTP